METIQPEQREAFLARLKEPPRKSRKPNPTLLIVAELRALAAEVNTDALPWRMATTRRLWHHETNCRHVAYHLSCAEFDMLEREAGGFCDICGRDIRAANNLPHIDHDHAIGWRAVRGLVCGSCNMLLGGVDRGMREPSRAERYYLDNPWYDRVGLEPITCPPGCALVSHRAG